MEAATGVMRAEGVTVHAADATILQPTSFELSTGRLVGLIGPSGGGKTTLLRVLAGEAAPSSGTVTIGDVPLADRTDAVGYVPFVDLLHDRLTPREALGYSAALRALPDATDAERDDRVDGVLEELSLTDRGDAMIGSLSGGERRRAAVGLELLGHPSVLLLDEPATGLDARLERRLMELLRELADEGRAVVVATHATASLELCDEIAVMGDDGRLRFRGTPATMLEHFDIPAYERVYDALEALDEDAGPRGDDTLPDSGRGPALAPARLASLPRQATLLASRYFRTFTRDQRTLAVLLGQAPVIGLAIGLVLPHAILGDPALAGYFGVILAFLLTVGSLWLGVITGCREVVKEQAIVVREAATGVRVDAFLLSRCIVLFPVAAFQAVVMLLVVGIFQPLGVSGPDFGTMLILCILTSWAAVTLGLLVSAFAGSSDQATSSVPLVLIPQLLLAGAVIPVAKMIGAMKALSLLALSRWSFAGLGHALNLDTRLPEDIGSVTGYDPAFFDANAGGAVLALLLFIVLMLSGTALVLGRRVRAL